MPGKTLALIVGLIIITIILLAIALRPLFLTPSSNQATNVPLTITPTPPAYSLLSLLPNPLTITQGRGELEVVIDSQENSLTAAQIELSYNPALITNITLTPGEFFPDPVELLNSVDTQTGRVTYALGITPAQTPVQGQGVVARISFDVVPGATGQTQIELLPKTAVTQHGVQASLLKEAVGASIIFDQTQSASQPASSFSPPVSINPTQ